MAKQKPNKPYPAYPLYPHSSGQWAKKIRAKTHYFGPWDKPDTALECYLHQKDDLHAGRTPRPRGAVDLLTLCNTFTFAKEKSVEAGEIKRESLLVYKRSCATLLEILGRTLDVESMQVSDFTRLREELAKRFPAAVTLQTQITKMRVIFGWAFDAGIIQKPLPFRVALKKPPARLLRQAKHERGKMLFTAAEIKDVIQQADGYMKPCVYLAINGGLGNRDVCELKWEHIQDEWLVFPRTKNYIGRKVWLWPETREALNDWQAAQPESEYVVCQPNGQPHGTKGASTPISHNFDELMTRKARGGRGFYAIRHTYRTVADGCRDQPAIALTMGHAESSIASHYRETIEDDRLRTVAEHVRKWFKRNRPTQSEAKFR